MTFWSTSAITFFRSPLWIDLSALTDSSTSVETVLTSASGACAACACAPKATEQGGGGEEPGEDSCLWRSWRDPCVERCGSVHQFARPCCRQGTQRAGADPAGCRRRGRQRRRRRRTVPAAAPAGSDAAGSGGCRRLRRVAVEDQAAPPLQVGVANEGVLVEGDVVDDAGGAEQAGAGVDDLQDASARPACRCRRRRPAAWRADRPGARPRRAPSTARGSAAPCRRRRRCRSDPSSARSPRSDGRGPSPRRRRARRTGRTACSC